MLGLITDRDQVNLDRLNELNVKGWNNMTPAEQAEWSGNPLLFDGGVNLLPANQYYASALELKYRNDSITAFVNTGGVYLYAVLLVGPAADYENKTLTLSLDSYYAYGGCTPQVAAYWHDSNGFEYAGASLTDTGSVTFTTTANTGGRENFALYLYATTDTAVEPGAFIRYKQLMLESGSVRHEYKPYSAVVPTMATKGAYNFSDLNRVEAAMAELADLAGVTLETKTDWTAWDVPLQKDLDRFLYNIAVMKQWFSVSPDMPELPSSMSRLTYTAANNIEKVIAALEEAIESRWRCGELYCGEV